MPKVRFGTLMSLFLLVVPAFASSVELPLLGNGITAPTNEKSRARIEMVGNLEFLRNAFHTQYAPVEWKKSFAKWDLDAQVDQFENQITHATTSLSLHDYQQVLRGLFLSARDYHTSISFVSTESATLPFAVKGAEGRYFISYIDREKLSSEAFPFNVGDELISFGEQSAADAVKALLGETVINSQQTDEELAEMYLTSRSGARGYRVPHGPITIVVQPKGSNKRTSRQLIWDYTPERVHFGGNVGNSILGGVESTQTEDRGDRWALARQMVGGDADMSAGASLVANPYGLGARKTFTPALGKKIWESAESDPFYAYVFQNTDKKLVGYVRIPSYVPDMYAKDTAAAVDHFKRIVSLFEATTDAMVIDQVNNPGGSIFYMYTLISMLGDQPMKTPRHRMMITQMDVMEALKTLQKLAPVKTDSDAQKAMGDEMDGYPATYESAQFVRNYCNFIISEANAGHALTSPYWIEGVDQINPAAEHYTKPILLLTNGLDFSGGDFFPATLQDNKRVTILGARTAGAGGYVLDFTYPNRFAVAGYRLTGSIAERVDQNPIENLGVKPDVEYAISADDLQNSYRGYIQKIQTTLSTLSAATNPVQTP